MVGEVGRGSTVWSGSAFDCSSANNEIVLLHVRFLCEIYNYDTCSYGVIVARSLSTEGNNYTSQLNVTVTPNTAGRAITCFYDNGLITIPLVYWVIPKPGLHSTASQN